MCECEHNNKDSESDIGMCDDHRIIETCRDCGKSRINYIDYGEWETC